MGSLWVSEAFGEGEEGRTLATEGGPYKGELPSPGAHLLGPSCLPRFHTEPGKTQPPATVALCSWEPAAPCALQFLTLS